MKKISLLILFVALLTGAIYTVDTLRQNAYESGKIDGLIEGADAGFKAGSEYGEFQKELELAPLLRKLTPTPVPTQPACSFENGWSYLGTDRGEFVINEVKLIVIVEGDWTHVWAPISGLTTDIEVGSVEETQDSELGIHFLLLGCSDGSIWKKDLPVDAPQTTGTQT